METIKTINKAEAEAIYFLNKVRGKDETCKFLMNLHVEEFEGEKCIVATDGKMLACVEWNREIEEGEYRIISCKKKESEIMKIDEPDFTFPRWKKILPKEEFVYTYHHVGAQNISYLYFIASQFGCINIEFFKKLPVQYLQELNIYKSFEEKPLNLKGLFGKQTYKFFILIMPIVSASFTHELEKIQEIKNNSRKEK